MRVFVRIVDENLDALAAGWTETTVRGGRLYAPPLIALPITRSGRVRGGIVLIEALETTLELTTLPEGDWRNLRRGDVLHLQFTGPMVTFHQGADPWL
jgi:hypothetical protein